MAYRDTYNVEYSDDIKTLLKAPKDLAGDYTVNSGVTTIAKSAFNGCEKLTSIHLPSSFKKLESSAFTGCKTLETIYYNGDLSDWLSVDWNSCFDAAYDLYLKNELVSEVTIPLATTIIKSFAFYRCKSIRKVTFHEGITEIGTSAFNKSYITGLLTLPEGLKKLKEYSFFCCMYLTDVKIPSTVNEIWYGAFGCCYELKNIIVSDLNPKFKTAIGVLYDDEGVLRAIAPRATEEPIKLPAAIHKIAADTFCYTAIPKGGLVLSRNITEIVNEAFLKVKGLDIYIPVGSAPYFKKLGLPMDSVHELFSIETAFLPGHEHISAITNNPFRILGVYANASQKEITANARKIKRFIEVGKPIEFPSDLNNLLPVVNRSTESVDAAIATLSNPQEKFKAALFWFVKVDDIDGIGLDNLQAGNYDKAIEIFEKRVNWHSLLNHTTLDFIQKRFEDAVNNITNSIHESAYHEEIATNVCGEEFQIDEDLAAHIVIDTLLEDLSLPECRALFKAQGTIQNDDDYLDELLSSKYTKLINDAIATARNISKSDVQGALEAGRRLKESTQAPLEEFAQYAGDDSAEYCMAADRLANQILQCAIDYYNDSIDRFAVFDALELAEYALSIVKGQVKKERCQQNYDILKRNAANIPPREVAEDDDFLSSFITKHQNDAGTMDNAWDILKNGAPSIVHIKECLSKISDKESTAYERMNNYLTMVSTALVNLSLIKLIDAVNNATGFRLATIDRAWLLMLNMSQFPMDADFKKNRFEENKATLRSMVRSELAKLQAVPQSAAFAIDLRTSEEVWDDCETIDDFEDYLERFPKGSHVRAAKSRIEQLKIEEEDEAWEEAKKSEKYNDYISEYPNGRYAEEAVREQRALERRRDDAAFRACRTISQYELYLRNYPHGRHYEEAQEKLVELRAEDDKIWKACKTKRDCEMYMAEHATGGHVKDAKAKIERIEKAAKVWWGVIVVEVITILILLAKVYSSPENFQGMTTAIIVMSLIAVVIYFVAKHSR